MYRQFIYQKNNLAHKEGKTEDVVHAPVVEDVEEVEEDDIDKNKPAEEDADEDN